MSDKIKENEEIETKNLESIPGENDLPDVKSKEHYEKLVTQRRVNSLEVGEVSTENLEGVAGGKGQVRRLIDRFFDPPVPESRPIPIDKYAGPRPKLEPLTPEKLKKIKEEIENRKNK